MLAWKEMVVGVAAPLIMSVCDHICFNTKHTQIRTKISHFRIITNALFCTQLQSSLQNPWHDETSYLQVRSMSRSDEVSVKCSRQEDGGEEEDCAHCHQRCSSHTVQYHVGITVVTRRTTHH